jgi:hypothetical protein
MVEYYALMYENGKMRPVETIPGMREGIKANTSTMIYCKNFCKCHNASPVQQYYKKNPKYRQTLEGLILTVN